MEAIFYILQVCVVFQMSTNMSTRLTGLLLGFDEIMYSAQQSVLSRLHGHRFITIGQHPGGPALSSPLSLCDRKKEVTPGGLLVLPGGTPLTFFPPEVG